MDHERARALLRHKRERLRATIGALTGEADLDEDESNASGELSSADQHPADLGSDTFERERVLGRV